MTSRLHTHIWTMGRLTVMTVMFSDLCHFVWFSCFLIKYRHTQYI